MKKFVRAVACSMSLLALLAPSALAHVTVQPNEAIAGSFSRFAVRVPNEDEKASTVKVELRLPPLAFVSFEPKEGWDRKETISEFDEPVDAFGQQITEGVTKVMWSGGEIGPGEFLEFGFSAKMPDEGGADLQFDALQTYSNGKVVKWTGAEDSDHPAPHLRTYDIGAEEGEGQLAVLARLAADESADGSDSESAETDERTQIEEPALAAEDVETDSQIPLFLSGAALLLAVVALLLAAKKRT